MQFTADPGHGLFIRNFVVRLFIKNRAKGGIATGLQSMDAS
jgi:hypothetical protein